MRLIDAITHGKCRGGKVDPRRLGQRVHVYCPVCGKLHAITLDEIIVAMGGSDEAVEAKRDAESDAGGDRGD